VDDAIVRHPGDFDVGHTVLVEEGEGSLALGLGFEICVLEPGATTREVTSQETVWLLIGGEANVEAGELHAAVARRSLFDERPTTLHVAAGTKVALETRSRAEWAVVRATNPRPFAPRLFRPDECGVELRGQGLAQGACEREVRLVFDVASRPESAVVVGEVVSLAGRWSSYPPHHHAQPELYHYRFSKPQGYGHAELGEHVAKVRSGDTLRIPAGLTHAQVAAPGYAMWYLWVVRHLDGAPYAGFQTEVEHAWTLDPARQGWRPRA
jgi:5-deoxy-glucuronate isomerase